MSSGNDAQRWAEVLSAFEEMVDLDAESFAKRLRVIGATDPELRSRLDELIAADADAEARLARIESALGSAVPGATAHEHEVDPLKLVGRTVSHFRVIAPLAFGGMGVVYRAEDIRLQRTIALKFPLPSYHVERTAKARFLHEARLAGAFDHPNVCGIYEAGETDDGLLFYAMPLYEGETLKARLAREGALGIPVALDIARQIAHGLSAAHGAGIVHRDLKPANVMLLPDGMVKILDFGLAKAVDLSLTASRMRMGTASYMAPEQVCGRDVDGRTDLWALGVVLYEMVTGRRPFRADNEVAVAHAIAHDEPARPSTLRPAISAHVETLVLKLLRKELTERCASAADVIAALAAISAGFPELSVRWPRRATSGRGSLRSHARVVVLSAAVLGALVAGAWMVRGMIGSPAGPRAVAVLPFRELGDERSHLATGLSDAISNDLQRIKAFVVPGYSSTSAYRSTNRLLRDVAAELEVGAVVTGSVRRTGDRVRIDTELFDVGGDRTIWSRQYQGSITEVHDIQRHVTRGIVGALRVGLDSAERTALSRPVTSDGRAFDLYLRGRDIEVRAAPLMSTSGVRLTIEQIQEAQSLFARARDIDPTFALARARLARMLMRAAFRYDTTQVRREQARLEAEIALRLNPGLPEAHAALAEYWLLGARDVPKAIEQLELAVGASPNHADSRIFLGTLYRDAGRWDEAVEQFERAMRLDRRDVRAPTQAAFTLLRLRRDEEAMRAFNRAIELDPDAHMLKVIKGHTYLRWKGITDTLAAVLRSLPPDWDPDGMTTWARYTVLRVERRDRDALAMLAASRSALSRDGLVYQPIALMRAQSHEALGDRAQARDQYEAALAVLRDSVAANPRDASARVALALAYAGLGRKADAIREARQGIDQVPLSQANPGTTAFMGVAVEVFGRVGEIDEALKLLELLLAMPAGREVTIPFLRLWPGFDSLRSDPRFDQLLKRFGTN